MISLEILHSITACLAVTPEGTRQAAMLVITMPASALDQQIQWELLEALYEYRDGHSWEEAAVAGIAAMAGTVSMILQAARLTPGEQLEVMPNLEEVINGHIMAVLNL